MSAKTKKQLKAAKRKKAIKAKKSGAAKVKSPKNSPRDKSASRRECGLCGATTNLTKTECCDNWICDDESEYALFSYARNSCYRNHRRYTLCGAHFMEEHSGRWQDCDACRTNYETEMYVYYGTNEYNFEVLDNPPTYKPTKCDQCGTVIDLGNGGFSQGPDGYKCFACTTAAHPELYR